MPHPVPYQGSKRNIAEHILRFFPLDTEGLYEPFAGSAAITIAAASRGKAEHFFVNDLNEPLIELWHAIVHSPSRLSANYTQLWNAQIGRERSFYDDIRRLFNETHRPELLLYLLARCVKASVRYNSSGEFNQSPDNRRLGRNPAQMKSDLFGVSHLLRGRTALSAHDFAKSVETATPRDLVYMDPPYQGTSGNRDGRYIKGLNVGALTDLLAKLNARDISYILSYDGHCGATKYGDALPKELTLYHLLIDAGVSSQGTLLGRSETTYESLYLSPALVERIELSAKYHGSILTKEQVSQLPLELA
ncbi:MAG TPA: DNA adenine methylase [Candidatus Kapabacteria bacterium]|nr:DNA adenine methylase [Candidatus Kapabacteria bacterium]